MARACSVSGSRYLSYAGAVGGGTLPLTLAAWCYHASSPGDASRIIGLGRSTSGNPILSLGIQSSGGLKLAAWHRDNSLAGNAALSAAVVPNGAWYHACGVLAAADSRAVYLNGANKGTDSTATSTTTVDRTAIGALIRSTTGNYFTGSIAEAAIWSAALTDAEVLALARGASPLMVRPDALLAYWPLIGRTSPEPDLCGAYPMSLSGTAPLQAAHVPNIRVPSRPQMLVLPGVAPPPPEPPPYVERTRIWAGARGYHRRVARFDSLADVPGLVAHWDASLGTYQNTARSTPAVAGDPVGGWTDQSGGDYHLAQPTDAQRPTLTADVFGSRPGVTFAPASLTSLTADALAGLGAGSDSPWTILAVIKQTSTTATQVLCGWSKTDWDRPLAYIQADGTSYRIVRRDDANVTASVTGAAIDQPDTNAHILAASFSGASGFIRVDGVLACGPAACDVGAITFNAFSVGRLRRPTGPNYFAGHIGALLIYNRALSAGECDHVSQLLARDWGIQQARAGVYYVDTVNGLDTRHGRTPQESLQTLTQARVKMAGASGTVFVTAPEAHPLREQYLQNGAGDVEIVPAPGESTFYHYGSTRFTTGWSAAGGGVYSRAVAVNPDSVVVTDLPGATWSAEGEQRRLLKNSSTPTTPAAGQYGWSAGTLYVHLPADADPEGHPIEVAQVSYCLCAYGAGSLTVRNAVLRYASGAGINAGFGAADPVGGTIYAYDCVSEYVGSARGAFSTSGQAVLLECRRCTGRFSRNDGFNCHSNTLLETDPIRTRVRLYDCIGEYNDDEGASPHDDVDLEVYGGHYHHNGQGGITGVNTASMHIEGAEIDHNNLTPEGPTEGGVYFANATMTGAIIGCNIHDNQRAWYVMDGSVVTISGNTISGNAQTEYPPAEAP